MTSNTRVNRTFRKDVRFSLISITLNTSYIVFSLPISMIPFHPNFGLNKFILFFLFVYYIAYSANFYLLFLANSLFKLSVIDVLIVSSIKLD